MEESVLLQDDTLSEIMSGPEPKIGIMGGTFDPIHYGHLIIGECAFEQLGLDKVLYIPAGNPPHKQQRDGAGNEQRYQMTRLAIEGNDHFALSGIEMFDPHLSYTSRTLRILKEHYPNVRLYFLMGSDSLLQFERWRLPEVISSLCTICVAVRDLLPDDVLDRTIDHYRRIFSSQIIKLNCPNIDISSTMIRSLIREGRSIRYYMPEAETEYIIRENLYRQKE